MRKWQLLISVQEPKHLQNRKNKSGLLYTPSFLSYTISLTHFLSRNHSSSLITSCAL